MTVNTHFISRNTALPSTRHIGVYGADGRRVGAVPLGSLTFPDSTVTGKFLYAFGALSDVHINYPTAEEDFRRALTYLVEKRGVAFTCICGDLTQNGSAEQLAQYKTVVDDCSPDTPVYAISGNHEKFLSATSDADIEAYTGHPLYYSFTYGEDVFVMCGVSSCEADGVFTDEYLDWLEAILEQNRDRRCFVFEHIPPRGDSGNANGLYHDEIWGTDAGDIPKCARFQALLAAHPRAVLFHGHSHLRFSLQELDPTANYSEAAGYRSVHIPSLAAPRSDSDADGDGSVDSVYAASEGYTVEVYENGILLLGRDFVSGLFLPVATYYIPTDTAVS